jgi:MoaA/NifB/PqqE/SkfB family radical SAM enzyme
MCHHAARKIEKQDFDLDLIGQFEDELLSVQQVTLTGLGEPLFSDSFWALVDTVAARRTSGTRPVLSFNTNGTLLNEANVRRLYQAPLKQIRISIDGSSEELYQKIRGTPLKTVLEGVRRLLTYRGASPYPKIGIEMTLMKENLHDIEGMIDLAHDLKVDHLEFWSLNELKEDLLAKWTIERNNWTFTYRDQLLSAIPAEELTPRIEAAFAYAASRKVHLMTLLLGEQRHSEGFPTDIAHGVLQDAPETADIPWKEGSIRCALPWVQLRTTYQGDVFPCCWGQKPFDSLRSHTLKEVWEGDGINRLRRDLVAGRLHPSCAGSPCHHIKGRKK